MKIKTVIPGLIIFLLAVVLTLGCGGNKATGSQDQEESPPVARAETGVEKVIIPTEDGPVIYGTFIWLDDGESHPAVILCHQFRSNRQSYRGFQEKLASNGISSLAIDFRGFGESTDSGLSYENFGDQDYHNMLKDINAALVFMQSETVTDRVEPTNIGLVGASIGANLSIMAGAEIEGLKCIAALSPGRSWHGLEPLPYAPRVEIPSLVAYAKDDKQSAELIPDLREAFGGNTPEIIELPGSEHGTNMLAKGLDDTLLKWLKEKL